MLSLETKTRLSVLIKAIAESEKKIEIVRHVLAEQPMFEPYAAFQRIDRLGRKCISSSDIVSFLK